MQRKRARIMWLQSQRFSEKTLPIIKNLNPISSYLHDVDETEERMNKQLAEAAKRENVLVLRLSAREQELQDVAAVAVKYRQQQVLFTFQAFGIHPCHYSFYDQVRNIHVISDDVQMYFVTHTRPLSMTIEL